MAVMFKTQQGRTLRNDEMTAEDIVRALSNWEPITGHELGFSTGAAKPTVIHVGHRHVVEWWDS